MPSPSVCPPLPTFEQWSESALADDFSELGSDSICRETRLARIVRMRSERKGLDIFDACVYSAFIRFTPKEPWGTVCETYPVAFLLVRLLVGFPFSKQSDQCMCLLMEKLGKTPCHLLAIESLRSRRTVRVIGVRAFEPRLLFHGFSEQVLRIQHVTGGSWSTFCLLS